MRIILYTGKGGVGKTSIAAATACHLSGQGKKVLIMSTDQAHSLRDSFRMELGPEPVEVKENLSALEIDAIVENEKLWGYLKGYIEQLFFLNAEKNLSNEELLVFPGFEELLALMKIKQIEQENNFDILIVDCAPTGETLSLLKFPELFKWWMMKIFPMKRKAVKIMKPVMGKLIKIPLPDDKAFEEVEEIYSKLDELHQLLLDKEKTSLRIVTTPEQIVITEAQRNFSCIHLFDFNVDSIVVNKIIPGEGMDGYFSKWADIQQKNLERIKSCFTPLPISYGMLMDEELKGVVNLEKMGKMLYRDTDPGAVLWNKKIFEIDNVEDHYHLKIHMPFVDKKDLDLYQRGDEISISIKNEKRSFALPKKLQSKAIEKAAYSEEGYLVIQFC